MPSPAPIAKNASAIGGSGGGIIAPRHDRPEGPRREERIARSVTKTKKCWSGETRSERASGAAALLYFVRMAAAAK